MTEMDRKITVLLSANEDKVGINIGMVEQQTSILAAYFRYLALLLNAYGKHCPKL